MLKNITSDIPLFTLNLLINVKFDNSRILQNFEFLLNFKILLNSTNSKILLNITNSKILLN